MGSVLKLMPARLSRIPGGHIISPASSGPAPLSPASAAARRIREVSGHDLGLPDTHFSLELATRAWRTLQVLRGS